MNHTLFVSLCQRIADLAGDIDRLFERNRAVVEAVAEGRALHHLHHEVVGTDIVNLTDVGVIQCRHCPHFPIEALVESLRRDFDGDVASHARIVRPIHFAHPAGADRRHDRIRSELFSGG